MKREHFTKCIPRYTVVVVSIGYALIIIDSESKPKIENNNSKYFNGGMFCKEALSHSAFGMFKIHCSFFFSILTTHFFFTFRTVRDRGSKDQFRDRKSVV